LRDTRGNPVTNLKAVLSGVADVDYSPSPTKGGASSPRKSFSKNRRNDDGYDDNENDYGSGNRGFLSFYIFHCSAELCFVKKSF
jgi:hypothetical protein